jgi:hypothetical protein
MLMTMNPLPPQAYTKDTLQRAYTWLLSQSPTIKQLATSQDMLISLYLKAQRNGEASLETPSIQNFKQELKSLANMIGDFSTAPGTAPSSASTGTTSAAQTAPASASYAGTTAAALTSTSTLGLDQYSSNAINDVRVALNLSSDVEALRALISLGYKQFKKLN